MKRADGTVNVLEDRRTISGTMIYGGVNNKYKKTMKTNQYQLRLGM